MDTEREITEDIRYVEGVTKNTQITCRKIVPTKPNVQTTKKKILLLHDFVNYIKEIGKSWR